jgi:hypothetical protein
MPSLYSLFTTPKKEEEGSFLDWNYEVRNTLIMNQQSHYKKLQANILHEHNRTLFNQILKEKICQGQLGILWEI